MKAHELTRLERRQGHWRATRRLTLALLLVWLLMVFGLPLAAPALQGWVGQWPLAFWWSAQGALLGFWLLVLVYAWLMRRVDTRHGMQEQEQEDG
jgi:putative solute:sodium symporter small subunit